MLRKKSKAVEKPKNRPGFVEFPQMVYMSLGRKLLTRTVADQAELDYAISKGWEKR